jgi:hypothetical protein
MVLIPLVVYAGKEIKNVFSVIVCTDNIVWFRVQFGIKHARVSFSKRIKNRLWKTQECMFFEIGR